MPAAAAPTHPSMPAFPNEEIDVGGGLVVRPLHTPGHTHEHTSYVIVLEGEPVAVLSGGSLLVGSAGRPVLLGPERAHTLSVLQFGSLHRVAELPRRLALYPVRARPPRRYPSRVRPGRAGTDRVRQWPMCRNARRRRISLRRPGRGRHSRAGRMLGGAREQVTVRMRLVPPDRGRRARRRTSDSERVR